MKQSHSLCSSMTTEQERHEAAYMEAVRSIAKPLFMGFSAIFQATQTQSSLVVCSSDHRIPD